MSFLVWLATYLFAYFVVMVPLFGEPEGFLATFGMVAVCWIIGNFVQAIFDEVTGR